MPEAVVRSAQPSIGGAEMSGNSGQSPHGAVGDGVGRVVVVDVVEALVVDVAVDVVVSGSHRHSPVSSHVPGSHSSVQHLVPSALTSGKAAGEAILQSVESGKPAIEHFRELASGELRTCEMVHERLEAALGFNVFKRPLR